MGEAMEAPRIVLTEIQKAFRLPDGKEILGIANLSFTVSDQEIVSIVGKSGCGKSTCLSIMIGLTPPSRGSVRIDALDPYADFDRFRGRVGVIFQTDRLIPWRTVLANTEIGLEVLDMPKPERQERARFWLDRLKLQEFENAYPHQLSGGMRQRVAIARAFAVNPGILFCDEAFGHLDAVTAAQLRAIFLELVHKTKKTCVFITHDVEEALEVSRRVLVFGSPARVLLSCRIEDGKVTDRNSLKTQIVRLIETGVPQ